MAAPDYFVYDGDGISIAPRIASVADLGGADKENSVTPPPDPVTMPDARDHNQIARVVAAHSAVTPSVVLDVRFDAGDPYIYGVAAKGTDVTAEIFTVSDEGDGLTAISWPAGTLPATNIRPHGLTITCDTVIDRALAYPVTGSSHAIRVSTALGATATDADFTVEIHGETT
jgi:hypothetical protein